MRHLIILTLILLIINTICLAQVGQTVRDNTASRNWPDGSMQNAIFYKCTQTEPQMLIVSLHNWSDDYTQKDMLAKEILQRDWNYIHPDFRGANNTPDACGSEKVISDIDDASQFAIANENVDKNQVHKTNSHS